MLILAVVIAVLGLGILVTWFLWDKRGSLFNGNMEKMSALYIRRDPVIERLELEIDSGHYLVDHKRQRSWELAGFQRKPSGGIAGIVITNDACIPQFPGLVKPDLAEVCKRLDEDNPYLVHNRAMAAIEKQNREHSQTALAKWMGIAVCISASAVGIMAIILLLSSGMMPWS